MSNLHSIRLLSNVKMLTILLVVFLAQAFAYDQEVTILEPDKTIIRATKSKQTDTYQVTLTAGQFIRVLVEQNEADVSVDLLTPDDKPLQLVNLRNYFGSESLSHEIATSGVYKIIIRTLTSTEGTYQVQLEVKDAATAQDKQRITAEQLLTESSRSGATALSLEQKLEKQQQALQSWRELDDKYWEAVTLDLIGRAYFLGKKYAQAVAALQQALALRAIISDHIGKVTTLVNMSFAYRLGDHRQQEQECLEQALAISIESKNPRLEKFALSNLAAYYSSRELYEKELGALARALRLDRESNKRLSEANILSRTGNAYFYLGQDEKALGFYNDALAIYRVFNDRQNIALMTRDLANVSYTTGHYEKAIEYLEQALPLWREVKNQNAEALAIHNLGSIYATLNRNERAIEYLEQALTLYRKIKNRTMEGWTIGSLGDIQLELKQYGKAIEHFEQSLAILREVKHKNYEGQMLARLGLAYHREGRSEQAIKFLEQSLLVLQGERSRAGTLVNLGEVWRGLAQYDKATSYDIQALKITREVKNASDEADPLKGLMLDWKAQSQPPLAIFFGKQAVNMYQEIRSNLRAIDRESQSSFLKSIEPTYRTLADLLITQGRLPEAEQVIRMLKEEEYFEYIRRDVANTSKSEKATLTPEEIAVEKRYREIADQLTTIGTNRSVLLEKKSRTPEEEKQLTRLEADLVVAGSSFQKFLDGLATEMSHQTERSGRVTQLQDAQGIMADLRDLGSNVAALYTLVGETKFRLILTTADVQKAYEYPIGEAELNRKILAWREALQNPKLDPRPAAQELYKIIFAPVAKDLQSMKAETLMWSLDGVLRYVPIGALYDGEKYLIEKYPGSVFTPVSNARLKDVPRPQWQALGLGVTRGFGDQVPALPAVAAEMRGIIRSDNQGKGIMPGIVKLDEAFTQESMLTGLRARPSVVHVASHFQFKPGNETDSALLLGDGKFLSLAQIKALPNVFSGVELLTLSACNTATGGSSANGKEVEGFGVLAQRQGAKAVIASLWPVVDRTTRILMEEFYRSREANKLTKGEALRQAQLKLLRGTLAKPPEEDLASRGILHETAQPSNAPKFKVDPKAPFAHPYYWAPFILIGNWK